MNIKDNFNKALGILGTVSIFRALIDFITAIVGIAQSGIIAISAATISSVLTFGIPLILLTGWLVYLFLRR